MKGHHSVTITSVSSAHFLAFDEPDGSSTSPSGSGFFSFFAPPPNIEKTLSFIAAAALLADSVYVVNMLLSVVDSAVDSVVVLLCPSFGWVASSVSCCANLGSADASCCVAGSRVVSVLADIFKVV